MSSTVRTVEATWRAGSWAWARPRPPPPPWPHSFPVQELADMERPERVRRTRGWRAGAVDAVWDGPSRGSTGRAGPSHGRTARRRDRSTPGRALRAGATGRPRLALRRGVDAGRAWCGLRRGAPRATDQGREGLPRSGPACAVHPARGGGGAPRDGRPGRRPPGGRSGRARCARPAPRRAGSTARQPVTRAPRQIPRRRFPDARAHREAARSGAWLVFDGSSRAHHATDWRLLDCLSELAGAGHADQLLIGGDTMTVTARDEGGASSGTGELRPRITRDLGEDLARTLLVDNPARAFTGD